MNKQTLRTGDWLELLSENAKLYNLMWRNIAIASSVGFVFGAFFITAIYWGMK